MMLVFAPSALAYDKRRHEHQHLGPGGVPDRAAVAHYAGGIRPHHVDDEEALIPCATVTHFRTSEISIAVTTRVSSIDNSQAYETFRKLYASFRKPKDLKDAKDIAEILVDLLQEEISFRFGMTLLQIDLPA